MKYVSLSLAAIFCATSPLAIQGVTQTSDTVQVNISNLNDNLEFVQWVRNQYIQGKYQDFLTKMEKDYQKAKKDQELDGLISMRKEDALIAAEQSTTADQWNKMADSWAQERNQELVKLLDVANGSILAQKIQSITQPLDSSDKETINYFLHLRTLVPGEGKNDDENFLIEQDIELEYKQIHLDSLSSLENWTPDHQEKRLALRIESLEKIAKASQEFKDKELKQKVETLSRLLDTCYAKQLDQQDFHRLAIGAIAPTSEAEKKAAAILSAYEGKFSDLTKDILQQTQSKHIE